MATCLQSISDSGGASGLPEIFPNTVTPFSLSLTANNLFLLRSPVFQTVSFNISLTSVPYNSTMTIFKWESGTASPVASVSITTASVFVVADLPVGDYIVCFRTTTSSQTGHFVCQFIGYSQFASFQSYGAMGQEMECALYVPDKPLKPCDEPLYFSILDGSLPPGLVMNSLGTIRGILPNLDCVDPPMSPAVNWWYEENDETMWPWGREWRFLVRVEIQGLDYEVFDDRWFCIRIFNNWTFDRDNWLSQSPFSSVEDIVVLEQPEMLPENVCVPCEGNEPQIFVPREIEPQCVACEQPNQSANVELIPIPLELCQLPTEEFLAWYDVNRDNPTGSPQIAKFLADLENSPAFEILRQRAGYIAPASTTPEQDEMMFVAASRYQNFLQLAIVRLAEDSDPNSLSQMVNMWKDYENQILPTTGYMHHGATMEVNLV